MVKVYNITYKQDGKRNRLAATSIKAQNPTRAKMKFVDQGYGVMFDIVEISEQEIK